MYKNIKCIHINLDYLKKKYYNNYRLNKLEKLLLIFIEQRKDKLLSITKNKYVKELIDYMDYLKIGDDYITIYDRDEFEKAVKEEFENDKIEFENDKIEFENDKIKFEEDKKNLAKELKILGIPLKKIQELTKLSINEITLL